MTDRTRFLLLAGAVLAAAACRLLPHPPNFAPVTAMALFAGATLADRRLALVVPLAAMLTSDLALGLLRAYGESGRLETAAGLLRALEEGPVGGDPKTAELLGVTRPTLYNLMKKYSIGD